MKFTIRDLFWLTVVVALAVGWWVSQRNHAIREQRLKDDFSRRIDELTEESLKDAKKLEDDFKKQVDELFPARESRERTNTLPGPPVTPNPPAGT